MDLRRFSYEIKCSLLIFLISLNVSLWDIQSPGSPVFDEIRYISAGKQFLSEGGRNENWSHPPLAKWFIGQGLRLAGDTPLGWRLMSSIFGAMTLVLMFLWALQIFKDRRGAWLVFFFGLFNQLHFMQSRFALLDVFMMTFILFGLVFFTPIFLRQNLSPKKIRVFAALAGVSFGLAAACKWFGIVPAIGCLLLFLKEDIIPSIKKRIAFAGFMFGYVPVFSYMCACAIFLGMLHPNYTSPASEVRAEIVPGKTYDVLDVLQLPLDMYKAQIQFSNVQHVYASSWISWPLMARPIWFTFSPSTVNRSQISGILYIGNIFILWTGVLALLVCGWSWFRRKDKETELILFFYCFFWVSWHFIPRQVTFFYYYYPAAMVLSLALVKFIKHIRWPRWLLIMFLIFCVLNFLFYYPLMTDMPISPEDFQKRILFKSWI